MFFLKKIKMITFKRSESQYNREWEYAQVDLKRIC